MTFQELNLIDGIQFMPVRADKRPIYEHWQEVRTKYDFTNAEACGIVCGSISMNLEAIDFDLKYDNSGTLMNDYIQAVNSIKPGLIDKMVVQRTKSGGYHMIYRCAQIEGNQKLANRPTTIQEREYTYQNTLHNKINEFSNQSNKYFQQDENIRFTNASIAAKNAMDRDKVRVLIETRGDKGYIACWPTPGYEIIQGSYYSIQEITSDERSILFDVAFSFNSYFKSKEDRPQALQQRKNFKGLTPSEDFDQRGDVVGLLCKHGWTVVGRKGDKIIMRRPGDTSAKSSGNFDEEKNWFSVFSTSTEFEAQKPYKPYAVFAMLECGGDYTQVTKKLADLGYGTPLEKVRELQNDIPSVIDMTDDNDLSFLAEDSDYDSYIEKWRTGTFEMGLSTGMTELDKYFLFKRGNLVTVNGIDNVGKSIIIWYKMFLAALLHGWRGIIFSSENKVGAVKKKMIEFYWCKSIDKLTDEEYNEANAFFKDHFKCIKNGDKLYNYRDFLNMLSKTLKVFPAEMALADPYNSFKLESKQPYEYHYEAASVMKLFIERNNLTLFLNAHVGTTAARKKDNEGYTVAPGKEDTEMGVMFANKADDFLTIHRLTDHESEFMYTEIHVRKVKETETGGRPTPKYKPIYLRSLEGLVGFIQVDDKSISAIGVNPVTTFRQNKNNLEKFDLFKSRAITVDLPESKSDIDEDAPF